MCHRTLEEVPLVFVVFTRDTHYTQAVGMKMFNYHLGYAKSRH